MMKMSDDGTKVVEHKEFVDSAKAREACGALTEECTEG